MRAWEADRVRAAWSGLGTVRIGRPAPWLAAVSVQLTRDVGAAGSAPQTMPAA